MNNDCTEIDELLLQIADYKNDFASVAAEKLCFALNSQYCLFCKLSVAVTSGAFFTYNLQISATG
jgi:hypothetical protein